MNEWNKYSLITITPFESPDERLAFSLHRAGAFSILDLGYQAEEGKKALLSLAKKINGPFGIRIPNGISLATDDIPENVETIILSDCSAISTYAGIPEKKIMVQVTDLDQAVLAEEAGIWAVIAKGSESGGAVKAKSSFILFQQIKSKLKIPVFVQGGCGIHTTPAVIAAGGAGVVFDSQLALLRESSVPEPLKEIIRKLDGTETKICVGHRVLSRPGALDTEDITTPAQLSAKLGGLDVKSNLIPMGQDIVFAKSLYEKYKSAKDVVFAVKSSVYAHIRQAGVLKPFGSDSLFVQDNNLRYPIAQGPMSSISDSPEFAHAVARGGGLPFIALSTLRGDPAVALLEKAAETLGDMNWGVGMLGFLPKQTYSEQLEYIIRVKPGYVIIAGGQPHQAKAFETEGIRAFFHVPTPGILDIFLKKGVRRFVFEGRECGGHIGPMSSFVLWEMQIEKLLAIEKPEELTLLFAGGIHDALSAAMLSVMVAPLVARGAKVGMLMGTSYLYTKEIVQLGAMKEYYQKKAVEGTETSLLSTSPGHEIRCLDSNYVQHFNAEKKELLKKDGKGEAVWKSLEKMNMGRLQIAAQGKKWVEGTILDVDETVQANEGLYMIGQVASLRYATTTIEDLHHSVTKGATHFISGVTVPAYPKKSDLPVDIAIIGMSCIYPGSPDCNAFWNNILSSKNLITEVPDNRWNKDIYYDPAAKDAKSGLAGKKTNTKWGGFIPDTLFDPLEYGIPPQSLAAIDPLQILALKVSSDALEDAGYKDQDFDKENTSVIFGIEPGSDLTGAYGLRNILPQYLGKVPEEFDQVLPTLTEDSFPGVLGNVLAGRIANRLDLGGKNFTVDGACASSLVAIDSACKELVTGGSYMVIAGGADNHNSINDYLMFSSLFTLSSTNKSSPFDTDTDGLCMGEGVAAVILKRYDDAINDGDRIYGVIRGVGGSSDGKSLGLTAPRKEGQIKAITRAYSQAGISAADVELVEAHGTGTVVGDKTELSAITEAFSNAGATPGTCALSAVKSQIGHTKCAAGMAGLIKSTLSVYHGVLPPTINIRNPNSYYNEKNSPFVFSGMARPWLSDNRIAGVSAFGFGGANFHVVIQNHQTTSPAPFIALQEWPAELIVLRGKNAWEVEQKIDKVVRLLSVGPKIRLRDIAYTLAIETEPVWATIVAKDCSDLRDKLEHYKSGVKSKNVYDVNPLGGKVAFLFPGQGSQRPGMLADLFIAFPFLKQYLDKTGELSRLLFPGDSFSSSQKMAMENSVKKTNHAQPLLGITGIAMASLLKKLGIKPDMLAGHSYGELPALSYSGAIEVKDLIRISQKRAESILDAVEDDPGAMAAVLGDMDEIGPIILRTPDVIIANQNSPKQSVISGPTKSVQTALEHLKANGVRAKKIQVHCAFHSPLVHKSESYFKSFLDGIDIQEPLIPVWSNTTAATYPKGAEKIRERLAEHLVKPVRFADQIKAMEKDGATVFIEVGAGNVLTGLLLDTIDKNHVAFNTDKKSKNGIKCLMSALAQYVATGRPLNFQALFEDRHVIPLDLDHPEQYQLKPTVWSVNGYTSVPVQGRLPQNAMHPVMEPLKFQESHPSDVLSGGDNRDETVVKYLDNVKEIMAAQRDVMLGYLGKLPEVPATPTSVVEKTPNVKQENIDKPSEPTKVKDLSNKPVEELLLEIVADRTGYPTDMLEMSLDLEADLSIDSIKRIEIIGAVTSQLGMDTGDDEASENIMEELAAIKTLEGIVDWLKEKKGEYVLDQNLPSPVGNSANTVFSREQIQDTLIEIVAEKTGYPVEMLDTNLDLEADLSVDSIKRIEILNGLNQQLSIFSDLEDNSEETMEELAAIKTLEGIVQWVSNKVAHHADPEPHNDATPVYPGGSHGPGNNNKDVSFALNRYKPVLTATRKSAKNNNSIKGTNFTLTKDNLGISEKLAVRLTELGAQVQIIENSDASGPLEKTDALIHLSPLSGKADGNAAIDFFNLIKRVNPDKVKWIFGVTGLGGSFGETPCEGISQDGYQGTAGFIKSLAKEWHTTQCKYIDVNPQEDHETVAKQIIYELLVDDTVCELGYSNGVRTIYNIHHESLQEDIKKDISLDDKSVVLALGGAKGITSEIIIKLAKRYKCKFILVGRSKIPESDEAQETSEISSVSELRKLILAQGKYKKPSEIESQIKKILSDRQFRETIKAITESGSTYEYVSLDVTDETLLTGLIQRIYASHGRIDAVLHGAGIIEDKFVNQKSPTSFQRVFSTKVNPARVLSRVIKDDVKFIVFFSSIASAFGNKGQIDYSSANDVLDKLAVTINRRIKGRAISINWGPWEGKGMVSEALEKTYAKSGIGLIPADEGANALINEMRFGKKADVQLIIMSGIPDVMLLQGEVIDA